MLVHRTAVNYELESLKFKVKSKERSYCDGCGRQLKWYENIPIVSWVIQKGKTRCCREKLSIAYPIVELITGIIFVIFYFGGTHYNVSLQMIIGFIIIIFLVFSAVFDLKYMILPDFSTWILVGCAVIRLLSNGHAGPSVLLQNIFAALIASGFLLILYLITKGEGMGMGDVKLALFMGLFLGAKKTIVAFYIAFIVGAVVGIILLVFFKFKRRSPIPFGPFLILGTIAAQFIKL